jgi:hypothetical protein
MAEKYDITEQNGGRRCGPIHNKKETSLHPHHSTGKSCGEVHKKVKL